MIMAEQRRVQEQRLPVTTMNNGEQGEEIMDKTASPTMTTTTAVVITTLTNVTTPSAPSAPSAAMNAIEMARATLNINKCCIGAMPMVGQTPRSHQGSGDTARGRRRISTARGDVAKATEKYYQEMLKI